MKLQILSIAIIAIQLLFVQQVNAQSLGDYRSVTTGNYNTLSTWQRFNGSTWVTPTTAQGWPGQFTGTGIVTIVSGHTVTITNIGLSTQPMGVFSIQNNAQLYLTGTNNGQNFGVNTPELRVNVGGSIYFLNKASLVLPLNSNLVVSTGGLLGDGCNANKAIVIGTTTFAQCQGGPSSVYTFNDLMLAGGTINAIATSNSPLCPGSTISLTGLYSGAIGSTPTYSWSVIAPGGATTVFNTQNVTINNAVSGTYAATLTVSTVLGGQTYTNSETINVIVNPTPTLTGASQPVTTCNATPATIQLTGLVPNTTFQLTYNIAGGSPVTVSGIVADVSGNASFQTVSLTAADNGRNLQITQIIITNPTTNCTASFNRNVTLSVWTTGEGTWTGRINSNWHEAGNWCVGVPNSSTDVFIPATSVSVPNQPVISSNDAVCANLNILTGASLSISGTRTLDVKGNWNNQGTFNAGTGTVSFTGSSVQNTTGNNTFHNFTVNNAAGLKAGSDITVNAVLNLASANPDETKGTIEMTKNYGDYSNVFTPVDSLTTRGTRSWDILDSWILYMGANATTTGQGDVTGRVKRTTIAENVEYTFGNQYTGITFNRNTSGTLPSAVMFVITKGSVRGIHANKTNTVQRLFQIIRTGGDLPTTFSVKLGYLDSELNYNNEESLVLWDHHIRYSSTNTPHEHGKSSQNISENWVSLAGHRIDYLAGNEVFDGFTKYWIISNSVIVGNQWLGAVQNDQTNWDNKSNWSAGNIPNCSDNVIIPSATLVPFAPVLPANATVGTITIKDGGVLNGGSGTLTICSGINRNRGTGSWNNLGTFNPNNSNVVFNFVRADSLETATISGIANFNNVTIGSGTYLLVQSDAQVNIAGNITKNGFLDAGSYSNTFEYSGNDAQTVVNPDLGNPGYSKLIFSGSGVKTLPQSSINVRGDLTFNAPVVSTNNTLVLNGNTQQTISGTVEPLLNKLTVNNTQGVLLSTGLGVNSELTLSSGVVTTGSNTLTVECDGTITGGSVSSHVNGKLARKYCNTGSKTFPVGKDGVYRPLALNFTSLTGTSTVTAEQFESTLTGSLPANVYTQEGRYWQVSQTGGSNLTFNLTLDGAPYEAPENDARIVYGDGETNTAAAAVVSNYQFTASSLSTFGNFAVGVECTAPVITSQPQSQSACVGSMAEFSVVTSTENVTYQWQVKTGPDAEFVNLSNDETYAGVTTSSLTVNSVISEYNGYKFRVIIDRSCGNSTTSNELTLTVNELPGIVLTNRNITACAGNTTALLAYSGTSASPTDYRLVYNQEALDAGFSNISSESLPHSPISLSIPVNATGTFTGTLYVSNTINGCESEPVVFTVTIYPLPQGIFSGNSICSGTKGLLTWTAKSGSGPFTVVYNDGVGERTANTVLSGVPFETFSTVSSTSQFTLVSVTGSTGCARSAGFTEGTATVTVSSGIWNGSESTDWHNASNWCGGVPTAGTDVLIPVWAQRQPVISTEDAYARDLMIEAGVTVEISADLQLIIGGNLLNDGTLKLGPAQLSFTATPDIINKGMIYSRRTGTSALPKGKAWGVGTIVFNAPSGVQTLVSGTFSDIIIDNPDGVVLDDATNVMIDESLSVYSGKITIGDGKKIDTQRVKNYAGPGGIVITGSSGEKPNGTFIFRNPTNDPVQATITMYSKAHATDYNDTTKKYSNYKWQYFGIPVRSVVANPTFHGSFLRRYDETVPTGSSQWITLNNASVLQSFKPYQITQNFAREIQYTGILENRDTVISLTYTTGSNYPGQHLIANPYTAAIDISEIEFGAATEATIYLYNTGSKADWAKYAVSGESPGQYLSIPKNMAGPEVPGDFQKEIPSMQGFLVKKLEQNTNNLEQFSIGLTYGNAARAGTRPQRARSNNSISEIAYTKIDVQGATFNDKLWIYDIPGCTRGFDNGWDGLKMFGHPNMPQIYVSEGSVNYQIQCSDNSDGTMIGFKPGIDAVYTLTFNHHNRLTDKFNRIYLTDIATAKSVDISDSGSVYQFSAVPGAAATNRFMISYFNNHPGNIEEKTVPLSIISQAGQLFIDNKSGKAGDLVIYNIQGSPVFRSTFKANGRTMIKANVVRGIYLVEAVIPQLKVQSRVLIE